MTLRANNRVRQKLAADGTILASSNKQPRGSKIRYLISNFSEFGYVTYSEKIANYNIPVRNGKCDPAVISKVIRKLVKENPHLPHLQIEVGLSVKSQANGVASIFMPAENTAIFQTTSWNYTEEKRFFEKDVEQRAERTAESIFTVSSEVFHKVTMILIRQTSLQ